METKNKYDELIELANKLFIYTDYQQWDKLLSQVFTKEITFDMSSLGAGDAKKMKATEVCDMWKSGFASVDNVHHQSGNFLIDFQSADNAEIFCYAIAIHFRKSATKGNTREFVGSYNLHAVLTDIGWRLDGFRYNLKFINGNTDLQ